MKSTGIKAATGAAALALLLAVAGCSGNGQAISAKDVGADWPFTVAEVHVQCAPTLAMFVVADGKAYPLNGQAERHPELYKSGKVGSLNDIWKVDVQTAKLTPDARMSLDAFTQRAIAACTRAGQWDPTKA